MPKPSRLRYSERVWFAVVSTSPARLCRSPYSIPSTRLQTLKSLRATQELGARRHKPDYQVQRRWRRTTTYHNRQSPFFRAMATTTQTKRDTAAAASPKTTKDHTRRRRCKLVPYRVRDRVEQIKKLVLYKDERLSCASQFIPCCRLSSYAASIHLRGACY
jgi:hypothetical protein